MIKVGIVGGGGYTAGELIRLLIHHPKAKLVFVQSKSQAGQLLSSTHSDLLGDTDLKFTDAPNYTNADVIFLCLAHGEAGKFLYETGLPDSIKIIDLSTDYRWGSNINATEQGWVYGLTEMNREAIKTATKIANPGCFATCIQLALLPLAQNNLITEAVNVTAITGSTGAGQKPTDTTHFSWRNNNLSVYEAFTHRHLKEINFSLRRAAMLGGLKEGNNLPKLFFIPMRGNFTRGIMASVYTECALPLEEIKKIYSDYYSDAPFLKISDTNIHLKQVVGSNKAILQITKHENTVHIISIIDNLLKGASGQAVENMNLMFGLEQTFGLHLKATGF